MSISEEKSVTILKELKINEPLWKTVADSRNRGSSVMSPFSITLVTALLRIGATGKTGEEIQKAFGFPFPSDLAMLSGAFGKLMASVKVSERQSCQIEIANAAFAQKNCKFTKEFMKATQTFEAEAKCADFSRSEDAAKEINSFVENTTKKKIDAIISSSDLNSLTHLVLVSAIYFKGMWKNKFDPKNTSKKLFTNMDGKQVNVDMMFQRIKCPFLELPKIGARAISLPYEGDRFKMVIILPDKADGLEAMEKKLEPQFFQSTSSKLKNIMEVQLSLPRFKTTCELDLKPIFQKIQLKSMFEDRNELGGFFEKSPNLFVSKIVHKAYIEVNEEGTEAAAATAAVVMMRSLPVTIEFSVDRPFLYYIVDEKYSVVLFVGSQVQFG